MGASAPAPGADKSIMPRGVQPDKDRSPGQANRPQLQRYAPAAPARMVAPTWAYNAPHASRVAGLKAPPRASASLSRTAPPPSRRQEQPAQSAGEPDVFDRGTSKASSAVRPLASGR